LLLQILQTESWHSEFFKVLETTHPAARLSTGVELPGCWKQNKQMVRLYQKPTAQQQQARLENQESLECLFQKKGKGALRKRDRGVRLRRHLVFESTGSRGSISFTPKGFRYLQSSNPETRGDKRCGGECCRCAATRKFFCAYRQDWFYIYRSFLLYLARFIIWQQPDVLEKAPQNGHASW